MKLQKIETIDYNGPVYNIEVEDNHNYYVSDILVSNCHENSSINGKHADLKRIHNLMGTCLPGTEIAIGGGNALAHPDIELFVSYLKSLNLLPSITINQKHIKPYFNKLKSLAFCGIGVSLTDPNNEEDFKLIDRFGNRVVIHTIAGILKPSDYPILKNRKVLILGYKDFRRGHTNLVNNSEEIKKNIEQLKNDLPMLVKHCRSISFDCLGIEQINPKEILHISDEEYNRLYQGHDYDMFDEYGNITVGTMFIDAVKMQVARSSTTPLDKRQTFVEKHNIKELLAMSCKSYNCKK